MQKTWLKLEKFSERSHTQEVTYCMFCLYQMGKHSKRQRAGSWLLVGEKKGKE